MPTHTSNGLEGRGGHKNKVWFISEPDTHVSVLPSPTNQALDLIRTTVGEALILVNRPQILRETDLIRGLAAVVFENPLLLEEHKDRVPAGIKAFAVEEIRKAA